MRLHGPVAVADDRRRFPVEQGIVRMLGDVDPRLAAELAAQRAAREIYLDERFITTLHEYELIRLLVEEPLVGTRGPILDAGCGVGPLGRLYPGLGLYGVDVSFSLLQHARVGYRLLVEASAEALPFEDGAFDVVVALGILHHVIHPPRAVAEFARVLKRGGLLVTLDPRKVAAVELAKKSLRGRDAAFAETHKAFTVDEYEALVRGEGAFTIEDFRRVGIVAPLAVGAMEAFRGVARRLPERWGRVALAGVLGIDRGLSRFASVRRAGLNLSMRARRH